MSRRDEDTATVISAVFSLVITLFLGGLFIYVVWNSIATACGLPTFEYITCVCAVGALDVIFSLIHGNKIGSKKGD